MKEHITLDNLPKGSLVIPNNIDDFVFDKDDDGSYINTIYELWFDVDSVFNTNTKEKDDTYIDFYTNYYPETKNLEAYFIECSDYDNEYYEYPLTPEEKQLLMDLLNERAKVMGYESIDDMCKAYIEEDKLEENEEELEFK